MANFVGAYKPEKNVVDETHPPLPKTDEGEDVVNHPSHYETGKFECIEVMNEALGQEAIKGFCVCNAFKYLYRCNRKNGLEDIKKAQWYLNKLIELIEK